jgi:hypothetical protein
MWKETVMQANKNEKIATAGQHSPRSHPVFAQAGPTLVIRALLPA